MGTLRDISRLRDELDWDWTRVAAAYRTTERTVRRWVEDGRAPELAPPVELNHYKIFVVSDTQFPYFDPALWEVATQIARDNAVEELILDGDIWDFQQLGRYAHNPYRLQPASQDVEDGWNQMLSPFLRANPQIKRKRAAMGNHEQRYLDYVEHNAGAIDDWKSLPEFLRLGEDWDVAGYGRGTGVWPTQDLLIAHGWRANQNTAKMSLLDLGGVVNVVVGHTHRVGVYYHQTIRGLVRAFEVGHMCDPTNLPKAVQGWQAWSRVAGTLITVARDGSYFDVEMLPVIGPGVVVAGGREYRLPK